MSLRVNDEQHFKKYNKTWKKVEKLMKVDFESKYTYGYDDKYIKTKIKRYADSITTNFHYKKMPKEKVSCKLLSIIMLDSVIKSDEKYYPQIFLEECKYVEEKIKFQNYIDEELDSGSDNNNDSDDEQVQKIFSYSKILIVCLLLENALLFFYICQSVQNDINIGI